MKNFNWKRMHTSFGELMTIEKFAGLVSSGFFTDYDGFGHYCLGDNESELVVTPSKFKKYGPHKSFTHVLWFNK